MLDVVRGGHFQDFPLIVKTIASFRRTARLAAASPARNPRQPHCGSTHMVLESLKVKSCGVRVKGQSKPVIGGELSCKGPGWPQNREITAGRVIATTHSEWGHGYGRLIARACQWMTTESGVSGPGGRRLGRWDPECENRPDLQLEGRPEGALNFPILVDPGQPFPCWEDVYGLSLVKDQAPIQRTRVPRLS